MYGRKRWTLHRGRDQRYPAQAPSGRAGAARCLQGRGGTGDQVCADAYGAPAAHRRRGVGRAGAAPGSHADRHARSSRGTDASTDGRATGTWTAAAACQAATDRLEAGTEAPAVTTLGETVAERNQPLFCGCLKKPYTS